MIFAENSIGMIYCRLLLNNISKPIINTVYSRKYWRELNLAVGSQIAIANVLADLNLAVRYGIAIRIYASKKFWRINLAVAQAVRQFAKFNSPPNFPAIRYNITLHEEGIYLNFKGVNKKIRLSIGTPFCILISNYDLKCCPELQMLDYINRFFSLLTV